MTPEEKDVIKAAKRYAQACQQEFEIKRIIAEYGLLFAVQALKVSTQPEHTVAPIPCGEPSSTGAMRCELPAGHTPDEALTWRDFATTPEGVIWQYAYRRHEGRAKDGSYRMWTTWAERMKP